MTMRVLFLVLSLASIGGCGTPHDACESQTSPLETVGCNGGFASTTPAPNTPSGTCTVGPTTAGSCFTPGRCIGDPGSPGVCLLPCPATIPVSTGDCPIGFRCHMVTGTCLQDCDETHACPEGLFCNSARCIPPFSF